MVMARLPLAKPQNGLELTHLVHPVVVVVVNHDGNTEKYVADHMRSKEVSLLSTRRSLVTSEI